MRCKRECFPGTLSDSRGLPAPRRRRTGPSIGRPMRRLLAFVCVVVFVDTLFYAAITPMLPELTDRYGLTKTAAGVLGGRVSGRDVRRARCRAAGWPRAPACGRPCCSGSA